ncbi:MAG: hypothetical protein V4465_03220 [Patescibacteria group bacterium]
MNKRSLIGLFIILLLFGFCVFLYHRESTRLQDENLMLKANLVAADHESAISGIRKFLLGISYAVDATGADAHTCAEILGRISSMYPYLQNVGVIDTSGALICSGLEPRGSVSFKDDSDFASLIRTKDFVMSDYTKGPIMKEPGIRFYQPIITKDGELKGAVFVGLGVEWLNSLGPSATSLERTLIVKFDRQGTVYMRFPDPLTWNGTDQSDSDLFTYIQAHKTGYVWIKGLAGATRRYYFRPIYQNTDIQSYVAVASIE